MGEACACQGQWDPPRPPEVCMLSCAQHQSPPTFSRGAARQHHAWDFCTLGPLPPISHLPPPFPTHPSVSSTLSGTQAALRGSAAPQWPARALGTPARPANDAAALEPHPGSLARCPAAPEEEASPLRLPLPAPMVSACPAPPHPHHPVKTASGMEAPAGEQQAPADVVRLRVSFKGRFTQASRGPGPAHWPPGGRQQRGKRGEAKVLLAPAALGGARPALAAAASPLPSPCLPAGRGRRLALPGRRPLPGEPARHHALRRPDVQPVGEGGRRGERQVPAAGRGARPRLAHQRERRQRRQGAEGRWEPLLRGAAGCPWPPRRLAAWGPRPYAGSRPFGRRRRLLL